MVESCRDIHIRLSLLSQVFHCLQLKTVQKRYKFNQSRLEDGQSMSSKENSINYGYNLCLELFQYNRICNIPEVLVIFPD